MENIISFEQIKQHAQKAIFYLDIKEAASALKDIEFALRKTSDSNKNGEATELYLIFIRLKLLLIVRQSDEDLKKLFKMNLILMVNDSEIDLADRVEARQLIFSDSLKYEMVNRLIIEAIHANEELIGQNGIFISGESAAVAPTVKNWLLDYDRTYGTEPQKDIVWLDYVAQSRNTGALSAEEKSTLRKVLKFYEFLKPEYVLN